MIERRGVALLHHNDSTRLSISISLRELVAKSAVTTLSDRARFLDNVGIVSVFDSAAGARVDGNRVVLWITLEAAVDRFLKPRPDSVTFTFAQLGDTLEICRAAMPVP